MPQALTQRPEFYGTAITEVQITSDQNHGCEDLLERPPAIYTRVIPARSGSWAPSSGDDEHEHDNDNKARRFETVCSSNSTPHSPLTVITRIRVVKSNASLKLKRLDPVKMAYLRTSFVFGFAVLITWIPSSINRLYSLANKNEISFPLSVASGCVLPLQGVWNAIIYFTTSWSTVREEFKKIKTVFQEARNGTNGVSRLESRLGIQKSDRRNTFERSQMPSYQIGGEPPFGRDDVELDDRSVYAEESK